MSGRTVRIVGGGVAAGCLAAAMLVSTPAGGSAAKVPAAKAAITVPHWVAQVGESGHAGVYPWGMATETNGDIVIGDYENRVIRIMNTAGVLTQTVPMPGHNGQNAEPYAVAVSPVDSSLYVLDVGAEQVDIYNGPSLGYSLRGTYSFTNQTWLTQPFVYIARMAVDPAGNVWVENAYGVPGGQFAWPNAIYELTPDGSGNLSYTNNFFTTSDTTYPSPATMRGMDFGNGPCLGAPTSTCNDLYVVEPGNDFVEVVDAAAAAASPSTPDAGLIEKIGEPGPITTPGALSSDVRDVVVDSTNNLVYVTDPVYGRVDVYTTTGVSLTTFGTKGSAGNQFGGIRDLTIGPDGNLYIADYANYTVDVWSPYSATAMPAFIANEPTGIPGPPLGGLNKPQGVAVSPVDGNVYVADVYNNRVQEFGNLASAQSGMIAPIAAWGFRGGNTSTYGMSYPRGVAVNPSTGAVWVDNTRGGDFKIYTPNGTSTPPFVKQFGSAGEDPIQPYQEPNEYFYSRDLAFTADGSTAYIVDGENARIKEVVATAGSKFGTATTVVPCGTFQLVHTANIGCSGVAVGPNGMVYAVDSLDNSLYIYDSNLNLLATVTTPADMKNGDLNSPYGVSIDLTRHRLYISETKDNRIDMFDLSNPTAPSWLASFGTTGTGNTQFREPQGMAIDNSGNLYVTDLLNERVEVFTP